MKPTHIYVSGPMRGRDGSNFPAFFSAEAFLMGEFPEADICNPAREDVVRFGLHQLLVEDPSGLLAGRHLTDSTEFGERELRMVMGEDLAYITQHANLLVLLDGWQDSKGALAEKAAAESVGCEVVTLDSLIEALAECRMTEDTTETPFGAPGGDSEALDAALAGIHPVDGLLAGEVRMTSATGGEKGAKLAAFDQIDPGVLWELAEHFGRGARKYAAHNFRRGYPWSLSFSALNRHLWEMWGGKEWDVCDEHCDRPEPRGESEHGPTCFNHTGSRVIIAVIWHAMALAEFSRYPQFKEYDDRYVHAND